MADYKLIRPFLIAAFCCFVATSSAQGPGTDDTFKESGELRKRTTRTVGDMDRYINQLDKVDRALHQVDKAKSDDLRSRYDSFSKELAKLEEAQAKAISDIQKMKMTDTEYFTSWAKANSQIADTDLRYTSAARRSRVIERHRDVSDALSDIGVQLQPFMSDLRDVRAFLGADLSPNSVGKASERIRASRSDAQSLKDRVASVQTRLKDFLRETPK